MSYLLINIETGASYRMDDHQWLKALDRAKQNYWDPGKTAYDVAEVVKDDCEFLDDEGTILFTVLMALCENEEWDGNYIEKRNQIVEYEDTLYLADALKGTEFDPELVEFIYKGPFRICG